MPWRPHGRQEPLKSARHRERAMSPALLTGSVLTAAVWRSTGARWPDFRWIPNCAGWPNVEFGGPEGKKAVKLHGM